MSGESRPKDRGFYVGYLPLPRAHATFLLISLPLVVFGLAVGALGLSWSQPPRGEGFRQTGNASTWTGTLRLKPYPMLHVAGKGGTVEAWLLVEMGKFGSQTRFSDPDLDGAAVSVRGRRLSRDGRKMIELDPNHPDLGPPVLIQGASAPAVRAAELDAGDPVMIRGEVVDSKCYLGAMKPGAGRGHKACATLCISGGIPPVLLSRDEDGSPAYHLLADSTGAGLSGAGIESLKPLIGETVTLTGRVGRIGSWRVLMLDGLTPADAAVHLEE